MAGNSKKRAFPWLTEFDVAHRGLFRKGSAAEENTMAAVSAAMQAGYAAEIDVRTTADDIVIVFHDDTLDRMTDGVGRVDMWGFQQLKKHTVGASGQPIPSLPDVLDVVDSQRPLFIEIKSSRKLDIQKVCAGVRHSFEGYPGPVAVMSFDPRVVSWFKDYMPKYARGLVVGRELLLNFRSRMLLSYWLRKSKPDFMACDINLLPNNFCARWRGRGKPLLTWTVRTQQMEEIARQHADALIFEAPAVVGDNW